MTDEVISFCNQDTIKIKCHFLAPYKLCLYVVSAHVTSL